jgi:curved DNA-binding protein CbpA
MMTGSNRDPGGPPERSVPQPNLSSSDPYAVLGLKRGAALREVKRAYFALVRHYPPEEQPDAFKLIRAAYEKLRTGETKAETDLFLFRPPTPWQPRKRPGRLDLRFDLADLYLYLQTAGGDGQTDPRNDFRPIRL